MRKCASLVILGWQLMVGVACGKSNLLSAEKDGVRMELWLENPEATWQSLSACCSITNNRMTPYVIDLAAGSGTPPLFVTLADRLGKDVPATSPQAKFVSPGQAPLGTWSCRLLPGESMIVQFTLGEHFQSADLGAARLTAMWSGDFGDWVRPHTLSQTLLLPQEPAVFKRPLPWRMEFTSRELADREQRMQDGLQPLPPRSFLEKGKAANNASAANEATPTSAENRPQVDGSSAPWMQAMVLYERRRWLASWAAALTTILAATVFLTWMLKRRRR